MQKAKKKFVHPFSFPLNGISAAGSPGKITLSQITLTVESDFPLTGKELDTLASFLGDMVSSRCAEFKNCPQKSLTRESKVSAHHPLMSPIRKSGR